MKNNPVFSAFTTFIHKKIDFFFLIFISDFKKLSTEKWAFLGVLPQKAWFSAFYVDAFDKSYPHYFPIFRGQTVFIHNFPKNRVFSRFLSLSYTFFST